MTIHDRRPRSALGTCALTFVLISAPTFGSAGEMPGFEAASEASGK